MSHLLTQGPYITEPIAVIGMGCRFPGANSPEEFWQLLSSGEDIAREIPPERWDIDAYYDSDSNAPGKMYVRKGYFLDEVDQFDPHFFNLAPREAVALDPQQRLAMEVSWQTLENANLPPSSLVGSQTGLFLSTFWDDYSAHQLYAGDEQTIDRYNTLSNLRSMITGRLAHLLNIRGPSIQIDTACSASLTAIHLACQSLRSGECDLAFAGGVFLLLTPEITLGLCRMGALATDGRCKPFDRAADGFGQGEGCGMVLLKRLADAQADGDTIVALIRGSAINHDGTSRTVTTPNGSAQQMLLQQTIQQAGIAPQQVQYVEAHGTGTELGDPIEVFAIADAYCADRETPLAIGSVKSNIGHLNAAAGIAGFMKTVLALQHGKLPATLHIDQLNKRIPWQSLNITVPTTVTPWPANGTPRLAGVSAFGLSGSNAHVILEEAPSVYQDAQTDPIPSSSDRSHHLLILSAKTSEALQAQVENYCAYLQEPHQHSFADICHTAAIGRDHFAHRLALVATNSEQATAQLTAITNVTDHDSYSHVTPEQSPDVAMLFTGQGSQYIGMGRELYETSTTFHTTLDRCDEFFLQETGESLLTILYPEGRDGRQRIGSRKKQLSINNGTQNLYSESQLPLTNLLDNTTYTQPALFAIEYALAMLWQSWGIQPDILIGHSVGEIAAACVAGVFSLEDGLKLVAARGRLMGALPQDGAMISLQASEAEVRQAIKSFSDSVSIAAVNSPQSVVISGEEQAVLAIAEQLATEDVKTKRLTVSHAFHSPLMESILEEFRQVAQGITYHKPELSLVSNVTGKLAGDEVTTADYWVRHVREAVRFANGIETLHEQGIAIFLEIGPKPTLLGIAGEVKAISHQPSVSNPLGGYLPSLRKGYNEWQQMLTSLGQLYVHGVKINWEGFVQDYQRRKIILPTYPFQRERYWLDTSKKKLNVAPLRPLIDRTMRLPHQRQTIFEKAFSTKTLPFLADHQVYDTMVVPGACYLALALSGAELLFDNAGCVISDVIFPQPLILLAEEVRTVQLVVEAAEDPETSPSFQILSFVETDDHIEPLLHATGRIERIDSIAPTYSLMDCQTTCSSAVEPTAFYVHLAEGKVALGPTFRWFTSIAQGTESALAQMQLPDTVISVQGYPLFPSLIDACFQLVGAAMLGRAGGEEASMTQLPFALESLTLYGPTTHQDLWCHAKRTGENRWQLTLFIATGTVIAQITGFQLRELPPTTIYGDRLRTDWLYALDWQAAPLPDTEDITDDIVLPDCWLLFAVGSVSNTVAAALATSGTPTILVNSASTFSLDLSPRELNLLYQATVDPMNSLTLQQLLCEVATHYPTVGIVYLWGLEQTNNINTLSTQSLRLCAGLLHITQAILETGVKSRLWIVTQGCQMRPDARLSSSSPDLLSLYSTVASGALWGLGRTIMQEHPSLCCTCVELGEGNNVQQAMQLQQELMVGIADVHWDQQILYTNKKRYAARLVRWQSSTKGTASRQTVSKPRSYLITGGLGALGLEIAEQLVTDGVRYLILSGRRTDLSKDIAIRLQQWREQGTDVEVIQADITQQTDVERLLVACNAAAPLGGIIHAAGVLDDGLVQDQSIDRFEQVMAPKVNGTWLLHTLSQEMALDFFICFSSVASLLGSPGQSNYAAANAFMDTLMLQRQQMGLPGLSINWGAWGEVGMAASGEAQHRRHQTQAMQPMSPQKASKLLSYLMFQAAGQIGIFALDLDLLSQQEQWQLPFFASLRVERKSQGRIVAPIANLYTQLEALPAQARSDQLTQTIRAEIAQILGIATPEQVPLQQPLFEFGIDSLMALELKNKLERKLKSSLHSTIIFDHPTIQTLTTYLAGTLFDHLNDKPVEEGVTEEMISSSAANDHVSERIKELSTEDLLSYIKQFGENQ